MSFTQIQPKQKIESFTLSSDGFKIQARNTGIVAAILSLMKLGAKSHFEVDWKGATLRASSFSGLTRTYVPLNHISATVYRYGSSAGLLGSAMFLAFMGISQMPGR